MIKDLHLRLEIVKFFQDNIGENPFGNDFLDITKKQTQRSTSGTMWNQKAYAQQKKPPKWKGNLRNGTKYLPTTYPDKGLISKICKNSYKSKQQENKIFKWAKELSRHCFKEDIQRVNRYMKRCSTLLIIREMQIKTAVSPHTYQKGYHEKDKR